jgi:hypothetical protein
VYTFPEMVDLGGLFWVWPRFEKMHHDLQARGSIEDTSGRLESFLSFDDSDGSGRE